MRKILLLAVVFLTTLIAFGQDFSNKGKDFWVTSGWHYAMGTGTPPVMTLSLTSDVNTTYSIEAYGVGTIASGNIFANQVTNVNIPSTYFTYTPPSGGGNGLFNGKAIHITAAKPIVVYSFTTQQVSSAATLCLPTNVLGKQYYASSYTQLSANSTGNNFITIIAVEDNTVVEVIPSQATAGGWAANSVNTINLNKGQIYQVLGAMSGNSGSDLTGTSIRSVASGAGDCKRIAVFSGSGRVWIPNSCGNGADNLYQQLYPATTWGRKYLTVPSSGRARNYYRIIRPAPTAIVSLNGAVIPAASFINNFYEFNNTTPNLIESDSAICVAQYFTSSGCVGNANPYDPDMVILNPVEQNISDVTLISSDRMAHTPITPQHYIHVIMKNTGTGISSFKFDGGAIPAASWTIHPQDPNYSYLYLNNISETYHSLKSDSGFNAIAYGYANAETYAYSAGTNVKDLYQQIGVQTTYGIETTPSVCTNAPFKFKVSLPYIPDSMHWDFHGAIGMSPNNNTVYIDNTGNVAEDSATVVNGKTLHWYSIPITYTFSTNGTYPITITTFVPNGECGSQQDIDFDLGVSDPPTASFNAIVPGCYLEQVKVDETTPQIPKITYRQWWEFYDPVTNATTVFTNAPPNPPTAIRTVYHTFTTPGTIAAGTAKRIRYTSITTPGCLSDTIVQFIELPDIPNATIGGNNTVCLNSVPSVPVTFTGSLGTAEYVFTYNINGGAPITSAPSSGGTLIIPAPTNVAGTFVYNLVGVSNASPAGTPCTRAITGQSISIRINPLPAAAITGATTVCLNSASPTVTFTGSGSTAPYTFAYTINGVAQAPIVSNAAGVATVTAPTNVAGPFIYEITQVTDASSTTCSSNITATTTTITVQDLPNAAIASSATAVCQNATQPTITFTGSGGTAPYTFNYTINSVAQAPVVSNAAGVVTLSVPTTTVGPFVYEITQVTEGSAQACLRAITGQTITVNVNPLPNAAIAGAVTVCLNSAPDPVVTFTGSNATAPYTFDYTINGVPQAPVVSNAAGIATVNAPTTVVGTFIYAITQVTDGSGTTCSKPISGTSTTITVQDLPNGVIGGSAMAACLNSTSPTITFTGNTGTAPYTFTYTINGLTQPTVVSNAAGVATINVPTTVAGPFTYELTMVSEASAQLCSRTITGQTWMVTINPLPTASVAGATAVCRNAPQPTVTFTGNGATAPYTFEYTINGTPQTPLVSNAVGVATVLASTTVAGTFTYQLTRVTDASSTTCSQLQNGSTIITINDLPVALFAVSTPRCANSTITFANTSAPNAASATYDWVFNDPNATAGNPNNVTTNSLASTTHSFLVPNPYTVTMVATNSNGCESDPDAAVTFIVNDTPVADFDVPDVCINDVATVFTDLSQPAAQLGNPWYWIYGDPGSGPLNTSNGQNGSHLYPAPGIYRVYHGVTISATGCVDTAWHDITINSADPVSDFTPVNSCSADSASLINLSTVGFGNVTKLEIYWTGTGVPEVILNPVFNGVYKHKYPTLTTTQTYNIRMVAYSGIICSNTKINPVTVYATPVVSFAPIPDKCYLGGPYLITQGSEIGGVPGTGTYSGPGITNPNGTFDPTVAGIGTHNIKYTWTASNPGACIDTLTRTITVLDTAHAKFSVTLPSCEQTATLFSNLSTAPASVSLVSTVWDFGDLTGPQTFAIAASITHTYAGPGPYPVTMHTVDNSIPTGCLSTDTTAIINIDANHHIQWDATSGSENQPLCVNTSIVAIRYTLSGGATNVNFIPSLPAGLTSTVGGTPLTLTISGAPTTPSNYSFDIVTSGNTCLKDMTTVTINVAPDHAISLQGTSDSAQSVCVNTPIDPIVYDLGGGATGATVSGLPPGVTGVVTPGNTFTISGTPTTTAGGPLFNFFLQTTGNTCVKANTIGEIRVSPYPVPDFTFDKVSYCIPNANVGFINSTGPGLPSDYTYNWAFGDGGVSTGVSPTHLYRSEGPFNVIVRARSTVLLNHNVTGCESIKTKLLDFIHPQPKADFVFSKPSVCIGDNVTITDKTDGRDGTVNQWNWDLGDGSKTTVNPVTYTYADTITYNITLYTVNIHGCNSDTLTKPYVVYPYPKVNAGPDKFVLEGGSVELEASSYAREPQYTWTPGDYLTDTRTLRPRVSNPKSDMTYRLTVTGKGGCALSDEVFVKLLKFPVIPNTFSPNGDGINDTWRIDFLNTYPENRVQIFTRTGKIIFESRGYNTPWDGTIKGKPLPFDTYYYIIAPGNGRDPITGYVTILK